MENCLKLKDLSPLSNHEFSSQNKFLKISGWNILFLFENIFWVFFVAPWSLENQHSVTGKILEIYLEIRCFFRWVLGQSRVHLMFLKHFETILSTSDGDRQYLEKCEGSKKRNNPWDPNEVHTFALDHRLIGSVHLVSARCVSNSHPYDHFSYLYHGSKCLKCSHKVFQEPFVNRISSNFHVDSYAIFQSRYAEFRGIRVLQKIPKKYFRRAKCIPAWDFQEFILRSKLVIWEQNEKMP